MECDPLPERPDSDTPAARRPPADAKTSPTQPDEVGPLTERQLQVIAFVARGLTNRQVGEALGISERTVRNHMRTILRKLDANDRTHAVVLAIGNEWIAIPIEPAPTPVAKERSRPP
jgi:DNA-binding NarL/FixJ family response regulator